MHRSSRAILLMVTTALVTLGLARAMPAVRADAIGCANTPTGGYEVRYPYLDDATESALSGLGNATAGATVLDSRSYHRYVPAGIEHQPAPLLVALHGIGGSASSFEQVIQIEPVADAHGFIVALPTSTRSWDNSDRNTDVPFLRDVVAEVRNDLCVDAARIYVVGHSNGAFMTQRLACDANDLFAASVDVSAGDVENPLSGGHCQPDGPRYGEYPMPMAIYHGDEDPVISYDNGRTGFEKWVARLQCDPEPAEVVEDTYGTRETHRGCRRPDVLAREAATRQSEGTPPEHSAAGPYPGGLTQPVFELQFRTFAGGGHGWPDGCGGRPNCDPGDPRPFQTTREFNEELWAFLTARPRPTPAAPQCAFVDPAGMRRVLEGCETAG